MAKNVLDISSATKERFEASKQRMLKEGRDVGDITYEEYREYITGENFKVETHQNHLLLELLKMGGEITDLLFKRNWTVVAAADGAEFVSSDNPVGLTWIQNTGFQSPGFGLPGTQVTFPLSKKVALIGIYENGPAIGELPLEGVAAFNNCAISGATRCIYSAAEDFSWFGSGEIIKNREEF